MAMGSRSPNDHHTMDDEHPFRCGQANCSKAFRLFRQLQSHVKIHSDKKPFKCPHEPCDYESHYSGAVLVHVRQVHTNERRFKCQVPECTYASSTSRGLHTHHLTHMTREERPKFRCPHPGCSHEVLTPHGFKNHLRTHTGEKPYSCPYCSHVCTQNSHMRLHIRVRHQGERKFKCRQPGCSYAAGTPSDVRLHHAKMHSEAGKKVKRCVCTHPGCTYVGSDETLLVEHTRRHTGERPFVCSHPDCEFATTTARTLKTHNMQHTGERPYHCIHPGCGRQFIQPTECNSHYKANHIRKQDWIPGQRYYTVHKGAGR
ncbi:putative Transcriptional repressor CTCF [Hypsibius exemplaris]|uniref:Transcriptional repressor CTCF n=1 Tax=Hypsibius exemplaris TaxID=2072580 RepID=A0A1W0WE81_HYPEX|nr:putative Transcriptional repressor CTCF [Hypsibius exemplaris]